MCGEDGPELFQTNIWSPSFENSRILQDMTNAWSGKAPLSRVYIKLPWSEGNASYVQFKGLQKTIIYIYIYIYMCLCIHIYIYIYIDM